MKKLQLLICAILLGLLYSCKHEPEPYSHCYALNQPINMDYHDFDPDIEIATIIDSVIEKEIDINQDGLNDLRFRLITRPHFAIGYTFYSDFFVINDDIEILSSDSLYVDVLQEHDYVCPEDSWSGNQFFIFRYFGPSTDLGFWESGEEAKVGFKQVSTGKYGWFSIQVNFYEGITIKDYALGKI